MEGAVLALHVSAGGIDGSLCQSRGVGRVPRSGARGRRLRPGSAPEPARAIRLLCAGAVVVALVLRGGRRARHAAPAAVRRTPVLVRGAWAVAAIRARLPGVLPAAAAAARRPHHVVDARSDAGAAADLQRM